MARLVRSRELDWTTFEFDELTFAARSQACEALLCCRDDGLEPSEVVARSDGRLASRAGRGELLPPAVAASLLAAEAEGQVVGPYESAEGWGVLRVTGRRRPVPTDPDVHTAAVAELVGDVLDGEITRRIRWVGPV